MKKFLFILCLGLPFIGLAQSSNLGNWLVYIGSKKIDNRWNIHHEAQHRNYNAIGDLEQILLRTGIGYNLTENNNNLLLGYAFIYSENYLPNTDSKTDFSENRIYQQFITTQTIGRVNLQHRYRFEQRFFTDVFRLRFRYFLSFAIPLSRKVMADDTFYLSGYNEIFLNTSDNAFDRNRLYGGLGYRLNSKLRFEIGYMNQFLQNGNRDQINLFTFANF